MRVATWNVNSIKQRVPRLLPWLDQRQPDVAALFELQGPSAVTAAECGSTATPLKTIDLAAKVRSLWG